MFCVTSMVYSPEEITSRDTEIIHCFYISIDFWLFASTFSVQLSMILLLPKSLGAMAELTDGVTAESSLHHVEVLRHFSSVLRISLIR